MKQRILDFDPESMGRPRVGLVRLRNSLAGTIQTKAAVVQIPTTDETCGFLIVTRSCFVFTGDGFNTYYSGTGGAALRSADAVLNLFGKVPVIGERMSFDGAIGKIGKGRHQEANAILQKAFESIAEKIERFDFTKASEANAWFIGERVAYT